MKRLFIAVLAAVAALTGLVVATTPANAATDRATSTVAPITCHPHEDSCVLAFVGNNGNGYWMARQQDGTTWVRLTLVPGWSTNVAPITCAVEDQCVLDFVGVTEGGGHAYWRARQASDTSPYTWVRLTLVNGS